MKDDSLPLENFVATLDIGSTHVTVVTANENREILGATRVKCQGMKKGIIVNFDQVRTAILEAADEVERQTGAAIERIRLVVANTEAKSYTSFNTVPIKNNEVKISEIEKLSVLLKQNNSAGELIHVSPGSFVLDGKGEIINPVGMVGSELGAHSTQLCFPHSDLVNLVRCCNSAGIKVEGIVFKALASAEAVLDKDEKELGVCSVAIGASLTHVAVYAEGNLQFACDLPIGSHHITKDLSIGLRTTIAEAERIKKDHGHAVNYRDPSLIELDLNENKTSRAFSKSDVCYVIEPRVREIFAVVLRKLEENLLLSKIPRGIVLTGGGSLLPGICIIAQEAFDLHVRLGSPDGLVGMIENVCHPGASAAVGALSPKFSRVVMPWEAVENPSPERTFSKFFEKIKEIF